MLEGTRFAKLLQKTIDLLTLDRRITPANLLSAVHRIHTDSYDSELMLTHTRPSQQKGKERTSTRPQAKVLDHEASCASASGIMLNTIFCSSDSAENACTYLLEASSSAPSIVDCAQTCCNNARTYKLPKSRQTSAHAPG